MREQDWKRWLERLQELSPGQRQALMAQLHTPDEEQQVLALIDRVGESPVICPHCAGKRVVRNGQSDGLQRYKCRGCGKTFNALTATPLAAAASAMGIEHHALNMSAGTRVRGAWHIQNVNAYHSRFKGWIRRFRGVATSYLHHYLGWFRVLDRCAPAHLPPSQLLNLSLGRFARP